jgi:ubiquinone/menaquinone biosynthesis C-methylase UbiE
LNENQYATSDRYEARIYLSKKFGTNPKSKFKWIFEHFPKKENLKVLELGCGTGLFWLANRNEIPRTWTITLSDYSAGMLESTRKTLSILRCNFSYEVVDAENIGYPDKQFDLILANNMLYHVENRPAALAHISRILKDDGVFLASTMGKMNMLEMNELFNKFLSTRGKKFEFREFAFSLDNGAAQLSPFFPNVIMERFDDSLEIDEPEAIINYYRSFNEMHDNVIVLADADVEPFRVFLSNFIGSKGKLHVTRDSGIFVCRK